MLNSKLKQYRKGYKIIGTDIVIRKRPDVQNWEACIYIRAAKKYKVFSTHTQDIDEAIVFAISKETELKIMQKHGIEIFPTTFEKVASEWLVHLGKRVEQGSQSPTVLYQYKSILKNHMIPYFGQRGINDMKGDTIQDYITFIKGRGIRSKGVYNHHSVTLSGVMKYAQQKGYYRKLAIPKLEIPKFILTEVEERARFTDEEIETILRPTNIDTYIEIANTAIKKYNRMVLKSMIHFMLATGCRTNDLQLVEWSDFEFRKGGKPVVKFVNMTDEALENMGWDFDFYDHEDPNDILYLHVFLEGKKHPRWVPIEPSYIPHFLWWYRNSKHTKANDLVFAAHNGKWCENTSTWFKEYITILEIPDKVDDGVRTPYSLRHTFITKKLVEGVGPFDIAVQCGTSVQQIQKTYCHMLPEELYCKIFKIEKAQEPLKGVQKGVRAMMSHELMEKVFKQ